MRLGVKQCLAGCLGCFARWCKPMIYDVEPRRGVIDVCV